MINTHLAPWGYVAPEVHQAEGALSVRLGISVPAAITALRAIALDTRTPLLEAARQILAGADSAG